jgi:hypothetical protein
MASSKMNFRSNHRWNVFVSFFGAILLWLRNLWQHRPLRHTSAPGFRFTESSCSMSLSEGSVALLHGLFRRPIFVGEHGGCLGQIASIDFNVLVFRTLKLKKYRSGR